MSCMRCVSFGSITRRGITAHLLLLRGSTVPWIKLRKIRVYTILCRLIVRWPNCLDITRNNSSHQEKPDDDYRGLLFCFKVWRVYICIRIDSATPFLVNLSLLPQWRDCQIKSPLCLSCYNSWLPCLMILLLVWFFFEKLTAVYKLRRRVCPFLLWRPSPANVMMPRNCCCLLVILICCVFASFLSAAVYIGLALIAAVQIDGAIAAGWMNRSVSPCAIRRDCRVESCHFGSRSMGMPLSESLFARE